MAVLVSNQDPVPSNMIPRNSEPVNVKIDLNKPILTLTRNITIRAIRHSDAADLSRHGDNRKIAQNMSPSWPDPYTVDKAHDWIAHIRNESNWKSTLLGHPNLKQLTTEEKKEKGQMLPAAWTIAIDDKCVGGIGMDTKDDFSLSSLHFGYWIGEEHWGKGIVSEVVAAFIKWIWATFPHIVRVATGVYAWNPASGKVLTKNGFELEGRQKANVTRFGKITDLLLYATVREGTETVTTMPF